ncbi:MAG: hypothetical protein NAG76_03785 [Candidatus Pristimantibacillus lignocellulolyticus]|uniref:Uncharacterized protein n=1 Tax=Candidatus Pristimantibacillus lignocellulolyticus TaxID=2994561 RepID=A0A9J6ZI36_9BACL|nr:MAG: hypothetical protein NAG76_03785 [Candidatus Pristimantibacillus lignocellulolyticus]
MRISRRLTITIVIGLIIVVAIGLFYFLNRNTDQVKYHYPVIVDQDNEPIIPQSKSHEFDTDAQEAVVILEEDQSKLYVENLHLYYSSDGGLTSKELYTWAEGYKAQAWINGEYILFGTQLIEADSAEEGHRGSWMTVRLTSVPIVSAEEQWQFGPQELLSISLVEQPNLFFIQFRNGGEYVSEMVYQSSTYTWRSINQGLHDTVALTRQDLSNKFQPFISEEIIDMGNDVKAYVFIDDIGSIVYTEQPFELVKRYVGYDMIDATLMGFVDGTELVLGHFRNEAGDELLSLLNDGSSSNLPVETRLFIGEWIALNYSTFALITDHQIEIVMYNNGYDLIDNEPQYKQFSTKGATLIGSEGSLARYEVEGETRYLSLYDLVHTHNADFQSLLTTPLTDYKIDSVDRFSKDVVYETQPILEMDSSVVNTNEEIPEELDRAIDAIYEEVDYSFVKTYRKIDDVWYVIVDDKFYQYNNGALVEIGILPITMKMRIGEGFEGYGVKDFLRMNGKWIFTDTEASRIIMVNDKLEIEQELAVHLPNHLSLQGDLLHVTSPTWKYTVDKDFNLNDKRAIEYESSTDKNWVEVEFFRPSQYVKDKESGLTWYFLHGYLYQYNKQKQQYRTFYMGNNINARGTEQIIPYGDEILVMLDTRLERFNREGQWLGVIDYPRTEPDGIYVSSPEGENSYILDQVEGVIYLVQGYRIIRIDLNTSIVSMVFQQNYSDIGSISRYGNTIYFILHSNYEDKFQPLRTLEEMEYSQYTELVQLDLNSHDAERFLISGYVDRLELSADRPDQSEQPTIQLFRYNE